MFVPFENLPLRSRVWVFQSNRPFTAEELKSADLKLRAFTDEWAVHGNPFETSYSIRYNQFIILAADESAQSASGCSIDSSVRVLKALEQLFGVRLLDRNNVAFLQSDEVTLVPLQDLKQKFKDGILNEDSLAFNNLVATRQELEESWLAPAGQTWLKRYILNPLAKVK